MTNQLNLIRIRSDDCLFIVMYKTIEKFPQSIFYKILKDNDSCDFIFRDNNTLYVDLKPENLKQIIDYMRGYKIDFNDSLVLDFNRLNLNLNENIFIKQSNNKSSEEHNDNSDHKDNFAQSFFEKIIAPKDNLDSVTSMSEFNNIFTEITDSISNLNNNKNLRIVRPRKEKLEP